MKNVGNMTPVTKGLITLVVLAVLFFVGKQFVGNKPTVTVSSDTVAVNTDSLTQTIVMPLDGTNDVNAINTIKNNDVKHSADVAPVKSSSVKTKTKVKNVVKETSKPVVKEKKKSTDRENLELNNF